MAFPNANARNQYLRTQVETASKEQLVVMLFDGIIRFSEQARKALESKNIEESHHALIRAQAIVMELIVTVDKDKGGEIADNLIGLHAYAFNALVQCNMYKDISKIDEVQNIYRKLREGWVGAMDTLGLGAKSAAPSVSAAPAAAAPKTLPTGAPKAAAPAPAPSIPVATIPVQGKPLQGPGSNGIMAAAKPPVAPATNPAAAPVASKAGAYGMGRTAMIAGAYGKQPAAAVPAATPAAPVTVAAPTNGQQAAMLNAYQSGTRSIA